MTINTTTTVNATALNLILSYVSPTDDYVVYASGTNSYVGYVFRRTGNKMIQVSRASSQGSYTVSVSDTSIVATDIKVDTPYYVYSSIEGYGIYQLPPRTQGVMCYTVVICAILITMTYLFGRVFQWPKR